MSWNLPQKINYFSDPISWDKKLGKTFAWNFASVCASVYEYCDLASIKRERWRRFIKLLPQAYNTVPAYSKHYGLHGIDPSLIRSESDLPILPQISKADFKRYAAEGAPYHDAAFNPINLVSSVTSGSTGEPFRFFIDPRYKVEKTALRYRSWKRTGGDPFARKIYCGSQSARNAMPNAILIDLRFMQTKKQEYIELIRASKAKFLLGTPMSLFDLLWMLHEEHIDITFRGAVVTGHILAPGIRNFFMDRFQCAVFEYYGVGEIGPVASECEFHCGLHIQEENIIVEIVNDDGEPTPCGKIGNVLLTHLGNEIMPLIRYDIGDKGVLLEEQCACGRTSRRLLIEGRTGEHLLLGPHGESIYPTVLREVLDQYFEYFHRYQVVQNDFQNIAIRIIPTSQFRKVMENEIIEKVQKAISSPMNITLERVDFIPPISPGGKFQYFVSDLWRKKFPDGIFTAATLENRQDIALKKLENV